MTYRVLALDLDGTLLTSDHRILPEVRDAVARISTQAVVLLVFMGWMRCHGRNSTGIGR